MIYFFFYSFLFFIFSFLFFNLNKIKALFFFRRSGGGGVVLKPKQYARLSNEVKYKKQPSIQCKACGTINI